MKNVIITALLSIIIGLVAGWLLFRPADNTSPQERKILFYRDPMNPQITSPTPKKSSDGMDFVPVYEEASGAGGEKKIAYYKDPMHPWFTSDKPGKAPDCGMDMVPVYEGEGEMKGIKIDPVTVQNVGVKVEDVKTRKLTKVIRTVGKVQADETKIYSINTKIMGWVEKLYVDYTGKPVRKGEPLLELYSPELVSTQEEYLQALRYQRQLEQSSIDDARRGAVQLVESAKRRLLYWDIPESEIKELERRGQPKKTLTFFSPVDGYVMDKMVYKGQSVMAGMELYKIADLSTVWVIADIYQYELPWVKVGQKVDIELSYLAGRRFQGTVTYIYPMLSMETKTAKVRVEVRNNSPLAFKPEMFATVQIASPIAVNAVAVPDQAIIRSGERNIAVIALGGGYFDPREVKLGVMAEGYVQIVDGIKEGEKIVVSSQFLIDSESNLKAAISQMSGHAGMDMSKPIEQTARSAEEHQKPTARKQGEQGGHTDHKDKAKPDKKDPESHQHEVKRLNEEPTETGKQADTKVIQSANTKGEALKRIDPVCGMEADPSGKYNVTYKEKTYYFCSEEDMEKFKNDPEQYTGHEKHQ